MSETKRKYIVLWGKTIPDLEKKVTEKLNKGWTLVGGVTAGPSFYQAMVATVRV